MAFCILLATSVIAQQTQPNVIPNNVSGSMAAPEGSARPDSTQDYLQPLVANHTIAGAVTLVAGRDRTIYLQATGFRDLAAKTPMRTDDLFWIASVSKPLTASALMMLVDEGKVKLDDPVQKYLPEFKDQKVKPKADVSTNGPSKTSDSPGLSSLLPANHPIMVREILSHTSGLPFHSAAEPGALDLLPLRKAVRSYAAEPLVYQPGTDYLYSNEGLNTAARIIEVVSGIPYEQFMLKRLFDPLGMKDTTFWPNSEQISRLAKTYKLDAQTKELITVPVSQLTYPLDDRKHRYPMPAGGLFSTASDLEKFCRMVLNRGTLDGKRYLSLEAVKTMTSRQNGGLGKADYGFGWTVAANGFGHGGAFRNLIDINTVTGRILVFMVQQDGPWGTADGDAINSTLKHLSDEMIKSYSNAR